MIHVWHGVLAGSAIGLLMTTLYFITNKQLGISQVYAYAGQLLPGAKLFRNEESRLTNSWQVWFGIGISLGGLLAAVTSGNRFAISSSMGELYEQLLPVSPYLKIFQLVTSGMLMGLGARMAGGCTSGHVISGIPMLNIPSIIAGSLFFLGGTIAVQVMFFIGSA